MVTNFTLSHLKKNPVHANANVLISACKLKWKKDNYFGEILSYFQVHKRENTKIAD